MLGKLSPKLEITVSSLEVASEMWESEAKISLNARYSLIMSTIATVQVRQRGSIDFPSYYESLCALQDTCPLREILSGARQGRIEVNADRVRLSDWYPLLKALQINKSLLHIGVRRYRRRQPSETGTYSTLVGVGVACALINCSS